MQMADPLTALIHAVQVMNFLKMLIMKTLREREESAAATLFAEWPDAFENTDHPSNTIEVVVHEQDFDNHDLLESEESMRIRSKSDVGERYEGSRSSPAMRKRRTLGHSFKDEYENMEAEGILNRLSLRKGMQKVFRLSKTGKKSGRGLAL